jgi:hypothetical protein
MGTWGAGNFEDDTALDYLGDFAKAIIKEIERGMSDPRSLEPDGPT